MIIGKNIDLRPVEVRDAEFILALRLDNELNKYLSPVEDSIGQQRAWLANLITDAKQYYFIVQNKDAIPIGTVRIYNILANNFCWGSWIIVPQARYYGSFESAFLLYQYAFIEKKFDFTCFDVRKQNVKTLNFHIRFGATRIGENEQDVFLKFTKEDFDKRQPEYLLVIDQIKSCS